MELVPVGSLFGTQYLGLDFVGFADAKIRNQCGVKISGTLPVAKSNLHKHARTSI